ncbi:flavin reductase family protein [Streptacidiphilus sp. EB103A]|uniref:flavin reductase family protein n=1 Tax=Streptacidiphilus sp. EB103A TaxID=3156275 RepID=UPI003518A75C
MGHEGMAVAAIRYLRASAALPAEADPVVPAVPPLRAVGPDERLPDAVADPLLMRSVLGHFCTGVTVISALAADDTPAGFACQSFSSLSLDPPLVSFNVARTSASWPRIAHAGSFCVSVLAADQGGLCRTFAVSSASGADKFAGVEWSPSPGTGAPRIADALAWIDCTIHAVHVGGDHLIVLGRVCELSVGRADVGPLLFYRGGFGELTP